jgi:hypothetical protein
VRIPDIDFEIKPAMRETYGLFLVTAGKGIFIIDGIEYPVKRGNSVMLFPYSSISVKSYPNIMFEYKWVELTGFEIAVMISRTNFSKSRPVAPEIPVESLFQYFDVCDDNSDTVYAACRTNGKVLILLSYYIQYYPSRKSTETDYIMQARDYIERNFRDVSCTVKSVADKSRLTALTFTDILRKKRDFRLLSTSTTAESAEPAQCLTTRMFRLRMSPSR